MRIKQIFCIVMVLSLFFITKNIFAVSYDDIPIGTTQKEVLATYGKPLKQSIENGQTVFWYTSIAGTFADLLYFNGDTVAKRSLAKKEQPLTLQYYIEKLGQPEKSVYRYPADAPDSLSQRVHIWSSKGKVVITSGESNESQVLREETFAPMTLDQYFSSWGKEYANNKPVAITTPIVHLSATVTKTSSIAISIPVVLVVILIFAIIRFRYVLQHRNKQQKDETDIPHDPVTP